MIDYIFCKQPHFRVEPQVAIRMTKMVLKVAQIILISSKNVQVEADSDSIYLWMSDYHPDGGQLFYPLTDPPIPFVVCLGPATCGDDVTPSDMRAFYVEAGRGVYIHPGTWHNGVYVARRHAPARFLTRQGRVHGRISVSWASEFKTLLRVPLENPAVDHTK